MEYWSLTKELTIYIYGAAQLGKEILDDLIEAGYSIAAMIDNRYEQLQISYSIPVISPDDNILKNNARDSAIIITLQNGMIHEAIAQKYAAIGISKIVFCPFGKMLSVERKHQMRFAYYEIVTARNFDVKIPSVLFKETSDNRIIINDNYTDAISFYANVEDLFITGEENRYSRKKSSNNTRRLFLAGKKAIEFDEYRDLFFHLRSGDANIENTQKYLLFSGREDEHEQINLLEDRKKLYAFYEEAQRLDPSFFIDSPIECAIQSRKICIIDGYHRFFYLFVNGYTYVPVIMSKQDYLLLMEH